MIPSIFETAALLGAAVVAVVVVVVVPVVGVVTGPVAVAVVNNVHGSRSYSRNSILPEAELAKIIW